MKRFVALADRLSEPSLRLVAALNLFFLISFVVVLMLATGRAQADTPACKGKDLLVELQNPRRRRWPSWKPRRTKP